MNVVEFKCKAHLVLEEHWPGIMETFSRMPLNDESVRVIAINTKDQFMLIIVPRGRIEFEIDGVLFKQWGNVDDILLFRQFVQ